MKIFLSNWDTLRTLRLLLGIAVIIQGVASKEFIFALAGSLLALMAVANIGCCGSNGCAVKTKKVDNSNEKDIYEEVGDTK